MVGAGRGNGEPHEIFNSQIGPHGRTTQYMLRHHREDVIERAVQHLSDSTSLKLPAMLERQRVRAERQELEARQEASAVHTILVKRGLTQEQVNLLWKLHSVCPPEILKWMLLLAFVHLPASCHGAANITSSQHPACEL